MRSLKKSLCVLLCAVVCLGLFPLLTPEAEAAEKTWAASWSTAPINTGYYYNSRVYTDFLINASVRTVIQTTVGGEKLRLRFSNRYGSSALNIAAVRIARTGKRSDTEIIDGTSLPVTFNGSGSVSIPAGQTIYSDAVDMHTESFEKLSVSVYYQSFSAMATGGMTNALSYVEMGNVIDEKTFSSNAPLTLTSGTITYHTTPFLCGLDTWGEGNSCIVWFGDSTLANNSPYYLAEKLYLAGITNVGVAQEAIIGNQLLHDITGATNISNLYGEAGVTRFKEDVLDQSGVKAVFVKIGLNDILHPLTKSMHGLIPQATTDEIIAGYRQLISMAREKGIDIYFFGRQAWKGYQRSFYGAEEDDLVWSQRADDMRAVVNNWLRYYSGAEYISTDPLSDPQDKARIYAPYTTDGAHLTNLGAQVLVDLIPDRLLTGGRLSSIEEYYENGGTDIINYTPENLYTKYTPPAQTPQNNNSSQNEDVMTGGATLPPASTTPQTTPPTTSITITNPAGEPVTEIFLVEITTAPAAEPTTDSASQPQQEKIETLSTTAKVGIILFALLSVGVVSFGVVYGVNKKKSVD